MIDRQMNYLYKNGEFDTDTVATAYSWCGGSPVGIKDAGDGTPLVTAEFLATGAIGYIGIAAHSQARDLAQTGKSTYYKAPVIFTLSVSDDEDYQPWATGVTWAVGDLVRPDFDTSGGILYAVWTNVALTDIGAYYGRVTEVVGTASDPTTLTIEFFTVPVVTV